MSSRSLPLLVAVASLAWPTSFAVAQSATARCDTIVLHGTSVGGGIDPGLPRDLQAQLGRMPFSSSNTWRSLGRSSRSVVAGAAFAVSYPNDHTGQVTWQVGETATRLRLEYQHLRPNGSAARPLLQANASWGEWVVGSGPSYQRGVLALATRCAR